MRLSDYLPRQTATAAKIITTINCDVGYGYVNVKKSVNHYIIRLCSPIFRRRSSLCADVGVSRHRMRAFLCFPRATTNAGHISMHIILDQRACSQFHSERMRLRLECIDTDLVAEVQRHFPCRYHSQLDREISNQPSIRSNDTRFLWLFSCFCFQ